MHPSRASGAHSQAVLGPAQFQVRTREVIFAFSINVGLARFDRFDTLLGSIGSRLTCHRAPPWLAHVGVYSPCRQLPAANRSVLTESPSHSSPTAGRRYACSRMCVRDVVVCGPPPPPGDRCMTA
eukprot:10490613-Alexandrium_andersonii.AAC.1